MNYKLAMLAKNGKSIMVEHLFQGMGTCIKHNPEKLQKIHCDH